MFEEFGPADPPQPPAGALEQAVQRGRKIRRQRHAGIASGLVLSAALIGGIALADPFQTNQGLVTPAGPSGPPPDYSPIPTTPYADPAVRQDLDFGRLSSVTTANGVITLHVDRTNFYQGEDAAAHGASENQDWITEDTDGEGKVLTFTLDPKASIQAEGPLDGDSQERVDLSREKFVANMTAIAATNRDDPDAATNIYVWLRHTDGPNGPVTALADQFIP